MDATAERRVRIHRERVRRQRPLLRSEHHGGDGGAAGLWQAQAARAAPPREDCVAIASYTIPLSMDEFPGDGDVDEVFRRINSGGRKSFLAPGTPDRRGHRATSHRPCAPSPPRCEATLPIVLKLPLNQDQRRSQDAW